jgi:hypothetical protein
MVKHVGKHNDKKVIILFREVPDEPHMCLVVYSDLLPRLVHDELMKAVESASGQQAKDISEVLNRTYMADGRIVLHTLHKEGFIKKAPTNQVLVTPNSKSSVRLDELNKILNEMATGEEAVKRLQELDSNRGMTGKRRPVEEGKEVGVPPSSINAINAEPTMSAEQYVAGVLSDADLAQQRLTQAADMKRQAEQMLAEAARLESEANTLNPTTTNGTTRTKKAKATKKQAA